MKKLIAVVIAVAITSLLGIADTLPPNSTYRSSSHQSGGANGSVSTGNGNGAGAANTVTITRGTNTKTYGLNSSGDGYEDGNGGSLEVTANGGGVFLYEEKQGSTVVDTGILYSKKTGGGGVQLVMQQF